MAATHGLLLDNAAARLACAGVREVIVTDTASGGGDVHPVVRRVSVAPLIGGAIRRLLADQSLGDLFAGPVAS